MNIQISSSTAVLVSACFLIVNAGHGQTHQHSASQNFYITTTPQTGEQTAAGGARNASAAQTQRTANTYIAQTTWQQPNTAATSRQSSRQAATSRQAYSVQQVSNQPTRQATQQAYANYYMNARAAQNSTANYTMNTQQAAQYPQTVSTSAHAGASQQSAQQTVYPAAYVSNASAEKKGLLSRLLHRDSSAHNHQHSSRIDQVANAPARAAKSVAYRASKLAGKMQQGMASWYGGKWHGRKTANGERYNQESMTAAHKTLPFGTMVKVTNERNGRECVVRINNRGPFTKGRILDLSRAAANQLNMVNAGVAKIRMEVVGRS